MMYMYMFKSVPNVRHCRVNTMHVHVVTCIYECDLVKQNHVSCVYLSLCLVYTYRLLIWPYLALTPIDMICYGFVQLAAQLVRITSLLWINRCLFYFITYKITIFYSLWIFFVNLFLHGGTYERPAKGLCIILDDIIIIMMYIHVPTCMYHVFTFLDSSWSFD